ncbi:hypothetical protein BD410DRAFT_744548, partial [Rickenella mellea]
MAQRDQYYNTNPSQQYHTQYTDTAEYDPYNNHQPQSYDTSVFEDEESYPKRTAADTSGKERSTYQEPPFPTAFVRPIKSSGDLRTWRRDHHGNLWTAGSRGSCIGRFCCCSLLIALFLIVSIVLTLIVWVRPPNIAINDVGLPSSGSAFQVTTTSLNLNLGVNISVDNPNYFAVAFSKIKADLTYPINNTAIGGGEKDDITFGSHTDTTFAFPFTVTYTVANDPNKAVLTDLLTKCGIIGGVKSDISVKYKITLGIKVLFATISPSFSNSFQFACPFSASDV